MKRVDEYITEREEKDFCSNCNEFCSRHCAIWRKAEVRYNEDEQECKENVKKLMDAGKIKEVVTEPRPSRPSAIRLGKKCD